MNRIGKIIKEARLKAKMTEKQLAKKCGVAESYIAQVEAGKKVINEKTAEKILEKLGEKPELLFHSAIDNEKPVEVQEKKTMKEVKAVVENFDIQPNEQWSDALAHIIKKLPIYEITSNKIVGYKELPVLGKKIEGHSWDKLMYIVSPDNEMEALRIKKGDIVTIVISNDIKNGGVYLLEVNQKKTIRQVRKEANKTIVISKGIKGEEAVILDISKVKIIGKCIKVEFSL